MPEKKEEETLKIKLPDFMKIKKNPWVLATFIFVALTIAGAVLLSINYFGGGSLGYCAVSGSSSSQASSPQQVGQGVVNFLSSRVNGTLAFQNITEISGLYQINVSYNGQTVPIYSTTDGKYLVQTIIPLQ